MNVVIPESTLTESSSTATMSGEKEEIENSAGWLDYPLMTIRGLPFPEKMAAVDGELEKVLDFKPNDSDIFIVTYPKCGTTWATFMVWEILHKGAVPPSPNQMMFRHIPFLESVGVESLEDLSPPRVMKTHLPFSLQPYNPLAKYIYIMRNPWDCCVSYKYHRQTKQGMDGLSFEVHFKQFIKGAMGFGDFFDHVLSWYPHRNDPNVLFLTYEGMKKDATKTLFKIAKFLGDNYYEYLQDEEVLQNCLKHSDFKYLKELGMFTPKHVPKSDEEKNEMKKLMRDVDRSKADPERYKEEDFFRKGSVGDWKNHFSKSQVAKFNEYMVRKLKGTEMENFWEPLDAEESLQ